jgi:hypothetical protein
MKLKNTHIQSPKRNTLRGLGGLLERVIPEAEAEVASGERRGRDDQIDPICLEIKSQDARSLVVIGDSVGIERSV